MGALNTSYTSGSILPAADMNATNAAVNGVTLSGTYGAMPTATQPGRIYYCTDCDAVFRDTGAAWVRVRFGQQGTNQAMAPTTGWSTTTLGTSSVSASADGYLMTGVGSGGSDNIVYHYRTLSPTSNYTALFYIDWNLRPQDSMTGFIGLSDGSRFVTFGSLGSTTKVTEFWSSTSLNGDELSNSVIFSSFPLTPWMGISDDGTNRNYLMSRNGVDWVTVYSTSRTAWLTPTQIGWGINTKGTVGANDYGRLRSLTGVS